MGHMLHPPDGGVQSLLGAVVEGVGDDLGSIIESKIKYYKI